jgi:hypothetical protein
MLRLEDEGEIAQPRSEAEGMGIGHNLFEIELIPFLVHESKAMDKGGAVAIGVQARLELCQALRQLNQETALSRDLID